MGANAIREAVADAGMRISDISLIISAGAATERKVPDQAALIQRALGEEAAGIPCFHVNTTCLSFIPAMSKCE